jgi:cytochrome P450
MSTATPTPDAPAAPAASPDSAAPAQAAAAAHAAPRALRELADLPGPRAWPVVGNLLQLDAPRFHLQVEQWCREFGPYFRLQMGPRPVLVVADHEVVATVLRDRPDGFRRTRLLEIIGAEMGLLPGVFGANGDAWKRQRRMVMAGFDPAHVKGYFPSMCRVSQRLAGRWQKAAAQSSAIDLQADLMRYTVDTIAGLAFGVEVNTLESDADVIQRHLDKIFPALYRRMMSPLPVWRWWRSAADRELERSVAAVRAAVADFIAQARARIAARPQLREHPENLLEAMIVAAEREGGGISDLEVAGNVLTMLLAGEDTTANTIAWMIHLLWLNPESLARATEEVRRSVADPLHPTLEEMAGLDFIEACAHETMRLKPVAPQLPLEALRETVVGDVRVPVGGVVISMLRRDSVSERFVPQAASFMPERWLTEGGPGSQANAARRISMPFGAGPRICPGRYLALLEMKMAMTVLLGAFGIQAVDTPDGQPAAEKLSFTMTPVGLSMRLRARG